MCLRFLLVLSIVFGLAGCATVGVLPTQANITKTMDYNESYDQVWSAIIAVIAESNLSISTLEKDSGLVSISNVSYEPFWADEGTRGSILGVSDQVVQRVADFNIFATQEGSDRTRVQVNSNFKMNIRHGNGSQAIPFTYQWQQAYSNGTLERLIFDGITRRIKSKQIQKFSKD